MSTGYNERVVAFIDILGFRELVWKVGEDDKLRKRIHRCLERIRDFKEFSLRNETAQKKLEVSVFSDSIAISGAVDELGTVLWTALGLQSRLLAMEVLVRGGIAKGRTFHADDMLYGEGLIKAYDLEGKTAVFPRIVIDPELLGEDQEGLKLKFLDWDADGQWYVDPFAMGVLPGNSEALVEDGHDPHFVFLEDFEKRIEAQIAELTDARQRDKWEWIKGCHAKALAFHRKFGTARIFYLIKLAEERGKLKGTTMWIEPGPAVKPSREWQD
jgi:hypothetical protein